MLEVWSEEHIEKKKMPRKPSNCAISYLTWWFNYSSRVVHRIQSVSVRMALRFFHYLLHFDLFWTLHFDLFKQFHIQLWLVAIDIYVLVSFHSLQYHRNGLLFDWLTVALLYIHFARRTSVPVRATNKSELLRLQNEWGGNISFATSRLFIPPALYPATFHSIREHFQVTTKMLNSFSPSIAEKFDTQIRWKWEAIPQMPARPSASSVNPAGLSLHAISGRSKLVPS